MTSLLPGNFETFRPDVPFEFIEEIKTIILDVLDANPELQTDITQSKMNVQGRLLDVLEGMERFTEIEKILDIRIARRAVCLALNEIPI